MLRQEAAQISSEIVRFVIENGRVMNADDGSIDQDSLSIELEFEAGERGYSIDEIAMILAT